MHSRLARPSGRLMNDIASQHCDRLGYTDNDSVKQASIQCYLHPQEIDV